MLLAKSEDIKNDLVEEQSIDFGETLLFGSVLSLVEALQDINFARMLPIRSEFWDECSSSILDSIGYNQMRILYFGLAFITKRSND